MRDLNVIREMNAEVESVRMGGHWIVRVHVGGRSETFYGETARSAAHQALSFLESLAAFPWHARLTQSSRGRA